MSQLKYYDTTTGTWIPVAIGAQGIQGVQGTSGLNLNTNAQTGTTYTVALSDNGGIVELGNASSITVTVPANATSAFPTGSQIVLLQTGAGQVTISPATIATTTYSSGGASGSTTFVVASATGIAIGQLVSGTGIAANTLVSGVSGTTITIDTATTAQVSGTLTFKVGVTATPGYSLRAKYSSATLIKRTVQNNDTWVLTGDLA